MSTAKQTLAAAAVALPLLLVASGTALAANGHSVSPPKASWIVKQTQEQAEQNHTVQNNINVSPITQVSNGGKGEQAALTFTQQNNYNGTEQTEGEMQVED
ncbi:hypothetical protein AB0I53_22970 [Saccharopolyspora sp. NPDC050389]|uniref:hypothetical protein n=1 Tax=Saccharopolyspora sp. NPDC050389 TaxID=3155516 RepID=UPI0033DFF128